jgi:hypothetical protein
MSNKPLILIILSLALIGVMVFSLINREDLQNKTNEEGIEWNLYHNTELGFSINIPSKVATIYKCLDVAEKEYVPVRVFEDNENGLVYITLEYYYNEDCEKEIISEELLEEPFFGWKISIDDINSEDDILSIVRNDFGSSCVIDTMEENEIGEYEITLKGTDWSSENGWGNCFIDYAYNILYSKESNKLMSVIQGQECTFGTYPYSVPYYCYDNDIVKSFSFR